MRRRPAFSVTSMRPSGRNASPHGFSSPVAKVSARTTPSVERGVGERIDGFWDAEPWLHATVASRGRIMTTRCRIGDSPCIGRAPRYYRMSVAQRFVHPMVSSLTLRAGPAALALIRDRGLRGEDVDIVPGASGG